MIPTSNPPSHPVKYSLTIALLIGSVMAGCAVISHPVPTSGLAAYQLNSSPQASRRGDLNTYDEVSMDEAWNAALQAAHAPCAYQIKRLGFIVTKRNSGPSQSELVARTQGNRKVETRLTDEKSPLLHTRIQIDTIGDESLSRPLMQQTQQCYGGIASGE